MTIKQIIVVREDLNMSRGKIASQVAHASMKSLVDAMERVEVKYPVMTDTSAGVEYSTKSALQLDLDSDKELKAWLEGSFTKIVVYVKSEEKLMNLYEKVKSAGLRVSLIIDNGTTEFGGVKTKTCIAIGPHDAERIDPFTKKYPLLK